MPSKLGKLIRKTRKSRDIGVRELARRIGRSGSFIVRLEKDEETPSVAEDTLHSIARELELDADELITLAGKTPEDVRPSDESEVKLFRRMKQLDKEQREQLEAFFDGLDDES